MKAVTFKSEERGTRSGRLLALALAAPALILVGVCFLVPLALIARLSFAPSQAGGAILAGLTLESYRAFLGDPFYRAMIVRSIALSILITMIVLFFTYPIALFLHRTRSRWRSLLVVVTIAPLLVSAVVRTYGWMVILGDNGWVNSTLRLMDLAPMELDNDYTGVVIGMIEILMPYMALALIVGFGRIDTTLEEAAASLGATPSRRFWRITLPLSLPGIGLGCMLSFVLAISAFVTPTLLGGGRVFLIATEIYTQALEILNWPLASAMAVLMLVAFTGALTLYSWVGRRWAGA